MRRLPLTLTLVVLLAAGSGVIWLIWASQQYSGQPGCPWGVPNNGHPARVGFALAVSAGLIGACVRWRLGTPREAAAVGLGTGMLAGLVVLVTAFFFGAGLQCTG